MSISNNVLTGLWTDYSHHHRTQILASDFWAEWMKTLVAVGLTLSGPYVFEILKSFIIGLHWWWNHVPDHDENQPLISRRQRPSLVQDGSATRSNDSRLDRETSQGNSVQPDVEAQEREDDSHDERERWRAEEDPIGMLRRARCGRELLKEFFNSGFQKGSDFFGRHAIVMMVILTSVLFVFVAQVVANVFSAKIATDRAAILASDHCGMYEFNDEKAGDEDAARADVYNYEKETRAGEYARSCYGSRTTTESMRCHFFYDSSITFDPPKRDQPCPFEDHTLCAGGYISAVTFDTGLVDASRLGINFNPTHRFRRKTTCSPLNMDHPHIRKWHYHGSNETGYHYYYGGIYDQYNCSDLITKYTLSTYGHPFEWLAPVYSVNIYGTTLYNCDVYRPIPALVPPENSTITIIFVSSMHIYYNKPSNDPIFPATEPIYKPGEREPYFYNSDPRARPLACIDTTLLCSPDGNDCWSMRAPLPAHVQNTTAYWLMKWSLENSNTYDSIKFRLGTALLAQGGVGQARSRPLRDNHWEDEAEQLFATSLARAQFDAWSIASGEDRKKPGYKDWTPDEGRGRLCGMYKFNSIGYVNVNLEAFIGLLFTLPVTFLLSRETEKVKAFFFGRCLSRKDINDGDNNSERSWEPLIINTLLYYLIILIYYILYGPFLFIRWVRKKW